jgi:hypothetical protein
MRQSADDGARTSHTHFREFAHGWVGRVYTRDPSKVRCVAHAGIEGSPDWAEYPTRRIQRRLAELAVHRLCALLVNAKADGSAAENRKENRRKRMGEYGIGNRKRVGMGRSEHVGLGRVPGSGGRITLK